MEMIIVCAVAVCLALVGVVVFQQSRAARLGGQLFTAKQDLRRAVAKTKRVTDRKTELEQRLRVTVVQLSESLTNTRGAIDVSRTIEVVSSQLAALCEYVSPEIQPAPPRHAIAPAPVDALDEPYDLDEYAQDDALDDVYDQDADDAPPADVRHNHVLHGHRVMRPQEPSPVSIAGGDITYVRRER